MENKDFSTYHDNVAILSPDAWHLFRDKIASMNYQQFITDQEDIEEPMNHRTQKEGKKHLKN